MISSRERRGKRSCSWEGNHQICCREKRGFSSNIPCHSVAAPPWFQHSTHYHTTELRSSNNRYTNINRTVRRQPEAITSQFIIFSFIFSVVSIPMMLYVFHFFFSRGRDSRDKMPATICHYVYSNYVYKLPLSKIVAIYETNPDFLVQVEEHGCVLYAIGKQEYIQR